MVNDQELQQPRGNALRQGRSSLANCAYHIIACTHDRQSLFAEFHAARAVINELRYADQSGRAKTLAFVVMPDHLHWLMQLVGTESLSHTVQMVKSFSARQVNASLNRRGPVWQRGFFDHGVRTEESLAAIARYIVANPLRAGMVREIGRYPHWDAIWL